MAQKVKFGRQPRAYDPSMPHASSLRMMSRLPLPIPEEYHSTQGMPEDLGMMLNDQLGDCTCAGAYHAMQIWSFHGRNKILTEPDSIVQSMYQEFCGYIPGNQKSDAGGSEQDIIRRWLVKGVPILEGSKNNSFGRSKIKAAMEVDPHNPEHLKRCIYECGIVYSGIEVPDSVCEVEEIPELWSSTSSNVTFGHCVILTGYDKDNTFDLISWGKKYRATWNFWKKYSEEAYGLVHPWWIEASGRTPFGISLQDLTAQMKAFCTSLESW